LLVSLLARPQAAHRLADQSLHRERPIRDHVSSWGIGEAEDRGEDHQHANQDDVDYRRQDQKSDDHYNGENLRRQVVRNGEFAGLGWRHGIHLTSAAIAKCIVLGCYTSAVNEQQIVDFFARAAKPRLLDLLKLKIRHVYETTPGDAKSKIVIGGSEVEFKLIRSAQPYKDIERFVAEDKVIGFVVNPGLLPIVKAISMDIRGRKILVTRRIQARDEDKGVVAYLEHFGMRIMMNFDSVRSETQVVWEALYGVA
jgi:hypothetical protein